MRGLCLAVLVAVASGFRLPPTRLLCIAKTTPPSSLAPAPAPGTAGTRLFARAAHKEEDDDEDDADTYLDDDELPLGKRIVIMLARLVRNLVLQALLLIKKIVMVSSIAVISGSFLLAQRAAIKSAQAISNAIIDCIKFCFKETFRALLSGLSFLWRRSLRRGRGGGGGGGTVSASPDPSGATSAVSERKRKKRRSGD